jgi:hypothetical protein
VNTETVIFLVLLFLDDFAFTESSGKSGSVRVTVSELIRDRKVSELKYLAFFTESEVLALSVWFPLETSVSVAGRMPRDKEVAGG